MTLADNAKKDMIAELCMMRAICGEQKNVPFAKLAGNDQKRNCPSFSTTAAGKGPYHRTAHLPGRLHVPHLSLLLPYDIGRCTRPKTSTLKHPFLRAIDHPAVLFSALIVNTPTYG